MSAARAGTLIRMPGKGLSRDPRAVDLLSRLLCPNPNQRLVLPGVLGEIPDLGYYLSTRVEDTSAQAPGDALDHPFLAGHAPESLPEAPGSA